MYIFFLPLIKYTLVILTFTFNKRFNSNIEYYAIRKKNGKNELEELRSTAEEMMNKGIHFYSLLFTNDVTSSFGAAFYHRRDTAAIEKYRMDQRLTILIQDNQEVLITGFIEGQIPQAIQTAEPMLILLAKEYIRHDMMMKVVGDKIGNDRLHSLWQSDDLLTYIVRNVKK